MAENKRYYFLQMPENFFGSKRIKRLRHLAGGDTYTIIYLKMQLKAMNNHGVLTYGGLVNSVAEEIAIDIDEQPDDVQMTMNYLQGCGLLEIRESGDCYLPYAEINVGSETASTIRSRKCREKKSVAMQQQCNALATNCNGDIDIEIDIDTDINKKKTISTKVDIAKEKVFSFDKHTNVENLEYYLSNDEQLSKIKPELKQAMIDWMEYRDEKKPKNKYHYGETGLKKWVTQTLNAVKRCNVQPVINQIDIAIANQWVGTNYDLVKDKES